MDGQYRFVMSYSGGKDGVLALYRTIKAGHNPVKLFTTYNKKNNSSWFHGISSKALQEVSKQLGISIELVETGLGDEYTKDFERALRNMKEQGANACAFGDIDIQEHFDWCDSRCKTVGIQSLFPLWNENRKELVYEFINLGFKAVITTIDSSRMDKKFLGKTLTKDLAEQIELDGVDICGENGEYHTFVYDGPLFEKTVDFNKGEIIKNGVYYSIPIL